MPPPSSLASREETLASKTANEPSASATGKTPPGLGFEHGRLGQYEILGKLGKGGMGTVFKARHTELGKLVALKVLPPDQMDEVLVARFKNEVRAIGCLDHPNVVTAYDAGEVRGVHYLVMHLVDGVDLARILQDQGRLSVPDACEVVRQAALGLQHAFERNLVHRDIKPSNLILARGGRVQVLDLGLARAVGDAAADTLTAKGTLLGTTDYVAPEQWEHAHATDTRADIYSLGCTLYHFLAGRAPFDDREHRSILKKMRAHLETPPPPIRQFRPEVPTELAAILERMLAKRPADRFESPAAVAEALEPFTSGADLEHLSSAVAPPGMPPASQTGLVATPEPGLWETALESGSRSRRPPVGPPRRRIPAPLVALCLLLASGTLLWLKFGSSPKPSEKPLEVTELHITHYRGKGATRLGDLQISPNVIHLNDDVRVAAELSVPAYYYLIAFNPDGQDQLCYPEDAEGRGAPTAVPEAQTVVRYPQEDSRVFVLDASGLQVFVLAASTKPLPPYAEWRSKVGAIPWKAVQEGGIWRWQFDGREFKRLPLERGRIEPKEGPPRPLQDLCDFFKSLSEFEAIHIVAFPVVKDQD
jgi:serine/threonine protein kinase